jgi:hypothetical protein
MIWKEEIFMSTVTGFLCGSPGSRSKNYDSDSELGFFVPNLENHMGGDETCINHPKKLRRQKKCITHVEPKMNYLLRSKTKAKNDPEGVEGGLDEDKEGPSNVGWKYHISLAKSKAKKEFREGKQLTLMGP